MAVASRKTGKYELEIDEALLFISFKDQFNKDHYWPFLIIDKALYSTNVDWDKLCDIDNTTFNTARRYKGECSIEDITTFISFNKLANCLVKKEVDSYILLGACGDFGFCAIDNKYTVTIYVDSETIYKEDIPYRP